MKKKKRKCAKCKKNVILAYYQKYARTCNNCKVRKMMGEYLWNLLDEDDIIRQE